MEQRLVNSRGARKGVRQAKTGAAAHKFDADAHAARKAGKDNKAEKVICPCGCGKMVAKALYKTGGAWHSQRNSKEVMDKKVKAKLRMEGRLS